MEEFGTGFGWNHVEMTVAVYGAGMAAASVAFAVELAFGGRRRRERTKNGAAKPSLVVG